MKTAGVVFDFYDDPTGSVLKSSFPNPDELPEQIKVAHILSTEEQDVLRDEAFALRMNNEGKILRKFACVDAGNTLLSMLYLEQAAEILPEEAIKIAAANITDFAESFGMDVTPFVKTAASGMARTRDSMRQPMVGDEADWAQRTNLVSVRGGADSGRVIPTANQMKTAEVDDEKLKEIYKKHGGGKSVFRGAFEGAKEGWKKTLATNTKAQEASEKAEEEMEKKDFLRLGAKKGFSESGKEKKSGVEGGGLTLTDDKKDNGPAKKNPVKPDTKVVDISSPSFKLKVCAAKKEKTASGRYPLDSYGDVQAAMRYFEEHWTEMSPAQRHEYAVPVLERVEELKIKTSSELLGRYGSTEYAPDVEAHIASRKASAPKEFGDAYNLLKEKRSSVSPDQFVGMLSDIDKACGLNWHYGASICDPYMATFGGMEKSAQAEEWAWTNADGVSVNQAQLQELAQTESISHNFGQDVGTAFKSDPVGIFESMPETSKTIMATLAKGLEKTSTINKVADRMATLKAMKNPAEYMAKAKSVTRSPATAGIRGALPSFGKVLGKG